MQENKANWKRSLRRPSRPHRAWSPLTTSLVCAIAILVNLILVLTAYACCRPHAQRAVGRARHAELAVVAQGGRGKQISKEDALVLER